MGRAGRAATGAWLYLPLVALANTLILMGIGTIVLALPACMGSIRYPQTIQSGSRRQQPARPDSSRSRRDQIEAHRLWIENMLNSLCTTAERWAAGELQLEGHPLYRP